MLLAKLNRLWADRSFAAGAVHPDPRNVGLVALLNDLVGDGGTGHEERGVHRRSDVADPGETWGLVGGCQVGIDGDRVIAVLAQAAKQAAGEIFRIVGNAGNSNALLREEIANRRHGAHKPVLFDYCAWRRGWGDTVGVRIGVVIPETGKR